jgi:hypothetical protein
MLQSEPLNVPPPNSMWLAPSAPVRVTRGSRAASAWPMSALAAATSRERA